MRAGAEAWVKLEDWKNAAASYRNLSGLLLVLGTISEAIPTARQAVDFADRSGDALRRIDCCTTLADTLHQSGDVVESERLFAEAERLQTERQPGYRSSIRSEAANIATSSSARA
jgi:hypothetical protein